MLRKYLTIGELADIMKISTSHIRFYEKEGLLSPCKIGDNGYRLYDFNEIERLDTILLLRKLDVPLKKMKSIMKNYFIDDYMVILNSSLSSIDSKIGQLKSKRAYVAKKLDYAQNFKKANKDYQVIHMSERILYHLHTGKICEYTIKETYELTKSQNLDFLDLLQDNYMIPLDNNIFSLCVLKTPGMEGYEAFDQISLPEGYYLTHGIFVQKQDEIYNEINKFYEYMKKNDISPIGTLITIENKRYAHFNLNTIFIELQVRIKI